MKIIYLLCLLLAVTIGDATVFTKPPNPPGTCGLRTGMTQAACTALSKRWLPGGDCAQYNVDNWPTPVVWVGNGCPNAQDGGCKVCFTGEIHHGVIFSEN